MALENKWEPAVGHEIKVGDYRFCAIPLSDSINISEVTSGAKIINIALTPALSLVVSTKEDTLQYLLTVGRQLEKAINQTGEFGEKIEKMKKIVYERLGEMPPIEDYDSDWITAKTSDVLN